MCNWSHYQIVIKKSTKKKTKKKTFVNGIANREKTMRTRKAFVFVLGILKMENS